MILKGDGSLMEAHIQANIGNGAKALEMPLQTRSGFRVRQILHQNGVAVIRLGAGGTTAPRGRRASGEGRRSDRRRAAFDFFVSGRRLRGRGAGRA